jgi:hypothetical protein
MEDLWMLSERRMMTMTVDMDFEVAGWTGDSSFFLLEANPLALPSETQSTRIV